jgi:hypothetical protein
MQYLTFVASENESTICNYHFDLPALNLISGDVEDKKVIVSGFSRSGSNLITEMVRRTRRFIFTDFILEFPRKVKATWIEDRTFFLDRFVCVPNYGTKQNIGVPNFSWLALENFMHKYNLYVVFCMRHPVDATLSAIVRGLPPEEGGDSWWLMEGKERKDITRKFGDFSHSRSWFVDHAIFKYGVGYDIYANLIARFSKRILVVRLEDVIVDVRTEAERICSFLGTPFNSSMLEPWKYLRHIPIKMRHGSGLNKNQINVYKSLDSAYNGFFKEEEDFVAKLSEELKEFSRVWGYE